jgi:Protein of unknown function (DUF2516)
MAYAAPIFVFDVLIYVNYALMIGALVIELVAFVHCLLQRAEAFAAIGTFSKGIWLLLTGASVVVTLFSPVLLILGLIAITVAAIYLLDVRPALRDAVDGHGPW